MWCDPKVRARRLMLPRNDGKVRFNGTDFPSLICAATASVLLDKMWKSFDQHPILLRRSDGDFDLDCDPIGLEEDRLTFEADIVISRRIAMNLVELGYLLVVTSTERGAPQRLEVADVPRRT
ncbi:hypothetical protein D869_gp122 [Caulobacter phage CcrRogue]|uniref:Uncharacterized protein n=1 Tax=Caulobacter phage CcrRogue TaxID=2927986 RepID=K4K3H0_9CAUD|nr:hypothetical protein D869_gp122 [Caulobacter phage CcrRogue]AFU86792.1 hypothetical protein CcrRogue_gp310 [Caulobacter phage CcrRogue]